MKLKCYLSSLELACGKTRGLRSSQGNMDSIIFMGFPYVNLLDGRCFEHETETHSIFGAIDEP